MEEATGRVRLGVMRAATDGVTGQGALAVLRFKVLAAGWAEVVLDGAEPMGAEGPLPRPVLPVVHGLQVK